MLGGASRTVDGEEIRVLHPGRHNLDAGPDFLGARIYIGEQQWAGNVEIHVKASDWYAHHHHEDPAYGNVILHVVGISDRMICDTSGGYIPQMILSFPETFTTLYERLARNIYDIACGDKISRLSRLAIVDWQESLAVERMQLKASRIADTLKLVEGDWERVCFVALARALGFGLNSEPFEILARSIPLNILHHHSDDIFQLEALLFGQAGMLDSSVHIFDEYYQRMCREYAFLARKYGLRPMRPGIWKYARTRPQNFPHRRIALLAKAVEGGFSLLSKVLQWRYDSERLRPLFEWRCDGYWQNHFDFDVGQDGVSYSLSRQSVDLLLINFVAPMIYAYGSAHGDCDMAERGLDLWRELSAEKNVLMRKWIELGIKPLNAMESQAMLQLRREYCDASRCLDCRFGHHLLRKSLE